MLIRKVIAYPDDCRAVRKSIPEHSSVVEQLVYIQRVGGSSPSVPTSPQEKLQFHTFLRKRPVEI